MNDIGFEGAMRGAFDGFGETADARVWENIEAAIAPQKKRAVIWWWAGAAAGVAALIGFTTLFNNDSLYQERQATILSDTINFDPCHDNPSESIHQESIESQGPGVFDESATYASSGNVSNNSNFTGLPSTSDDKNSNDRAVAIRSLKDAQFVNNLTSAEKDLRSDVSQDTSMSVSKEVLADLGFMDLMQLSWNPTVDSISNRVEDDFVIRSEEEVDWQDFDKQSSDDWALAANLGSSGATESSRSQSNGFSFVADPSSGIESLADQSARTNQNIRYLTPFIIGIRGNWGFSKRWSLESGLSYSLLPGVIESNSNNVRRVNRYNDHFIGMPLLLRFQFIDRKRIGFYSSTGMLFEKGIATRNVLTTTIGNQTSKQIIKDKAPGIQLGAQLGLGVDYRINKLFSLYAEPTITSWGSNENVPQNIRTAQLLWPSLNLGARFNLK